MDPASKGREVGEERSLGGRLGEFGKGREVGYPVIWEKPWMPGQMARVGFGSRRPSSGRDQQWIAVVVSTLLCDNVHEHGEFLPVLYRTNT